MIKENNTSTKKRKLWQSPWSYKEGIFIATGLFIIGLVLEFITMGRGIVSVIWPYNLILFLFIMIIIITLHIFFKEKKIIRWMSSIPAAISAITYLGIVTLLLGFIPQTLESKTLIDRLGLTHITSSHYFLFAEIYFLLTLGFITIKRAIPFQTKNIGFLLNHAGLFLVLFAAMMGSGDLQRLTMELYEGKISYQAKDNYGNVYQMPIAIQLNDFKIEEYNPKLALVNNQTGKFILEKGKSFILVDKNIEASLNTKDDSFKIKVINFIKDSIKKGQVYIPSKIMGSMPSAFLEITFKNGKKLKQWISSGSVFNKGEMIPLNKKYSLVMTQPEAKKFSSDVRIYTKPKKGDKDIQVKDAIIEVNKPITVNGWKIYQISYDEKYGKWSRLSVLELVKDPWLPIIYIGIFIMMAGAIYIFWIGQQIKGDIAR